MNSREIHWPLPQKVTKPSKCLQRLFSCCSKNMLPASAAITSTQHQSPTTENLTLWAGRQGQLKLGLWMATHRCLLEPILARWCLCTTVAPIMCLALSCQPSCDITRCYMEVLLGPGCCCWQTRMGGCWWKRLLLCVCV